ncbi:plasma membrane fusion protein PRM1, partial [Favolaschia claudopus]
INSSLSPAQTAANLLLTVLESLIEFFVDTYRSTFLCLLELVIQAGLSVLAAAATEATSFVEATANSIATAIQQLFSAATSALQSAVSAANKFPGVNIPLPPISAPNLSSLQSLSLPTTFEDQLHKLQSQLPQLDELRQIVDNL